MTATIGWECPKCGKVHAPWVAECDCHLSVHRDFTMTPPPFPPKVPTTGDPPPVPALVTVSGTNET